MDVNAHPDFAESYAIIRARHGAQWAKRFVLTAPLMLDDPHSQVRRAFLEALAAHGRGDHARAELVWATCQWLVRDLAERVVDEAEALLSDA